MFKMFVMTCIIWIEGSRYDGGEVKCGIHEAEIVFSSMFACKSNIPRYEEYVVKSIYDQFEMPSDYVINTMCYEDKME
tara:strand:- start:2200 stop:2433 length:234 start_codon:yes stop_codon:yes gene_type:complete